MQVSRSAIQLRFQKGSLEIKVNKEQFFEEMRRESRSKKSHKSLRLRSISHDPSANKQDTVPLLKIYSEVHFSDDLLEAISEGSSEDIHDEENGKVDQGMPTFQLGPAPGLDKQDSLVNTTEIKGATGQGESSF